MRVKLLSLRIGSSGADSKWEREREREVMPVVSRHICTERVWEGDSMLNVNGRGALRSHSLNRNAWNTCWPDAVWIRPACSNSKQRVRQRL